MKSYRKKMHSVWERVKPLIMFWFGPIERGKSRSW